MREWMGDVRTSVRQLVRTPGFTAASVAVLALGIGLNAAMFSVVYTLAFMTRPYAEPDRIVQLYSSETARPDSYRAFSHAAWNEIADGSSVFSGVLAHTPTMVGIGDGQDARRSFAAIVSDNYFDVLGVPIARGRGFTREESTPGRDIPVVVASWTFWQRQGFAPDLIGSDVRINERSFTVVGITPEGFTGTMAVFGPEMFFPLGVFHTLAHDFMGGEIPRSLQAQDAYHLFLVGRLRDGISMDVATSHLLPLAARLERAFPVEYRDARLSLTPLPRFGTSTTPRDERVVSMLSVVMMGLAAAVLLTVCLNLASMLLARGRARRKEFAVKLALGGSRWRLVRQLLIEGLLLALAGGAAGLALGAWGVDAFIAAFSSLVPITIAFDTSLSPTLVLATLMFCLMATAWFALGPALRHSRADVLADLKPHAGEDTPERRRRFMPRHPLVVAQVALSLALLVGAGLFIRMADAGMGVDLGFDADNTVLAEVDAGLAGFSHAQTTDLYADLERRLQALPGVDTVAVGALVPLGQVNISRDVRRAGPPLPDDVKPETAAEGRAFSTPWNAVSGGYFRAMGLRLVEGRTFTDSEAYSADSRRVAIIDRALAERLWPEGGALGQQIQFGPLRGSSTPQLPMEVVGIVSAVRRELFEKEMPGGVYVPFAQGPLGNAFFHVRPAAAGVALEDAVRHTIRDTASGLPLFSVRRFADHIGQSAEYWALGFTSSLLATFGALAMVVALVGLYGVMSYAVARRTREIGIRMAVGALPRTVRGMILSESLRTALAGVTIGWGLALGLGRLLASFFVDVAAFDAIVFTLVPVGFLAAAIVAAWIPARRATAVNPMVALRTE